MEYEKSAKLWWGSIIKIHTYIYGNKHFQHYHAWKSMDVMNKKLSRHLTIHMVVFQSNNMYTQVTKCDVTNS